MCFGAPLPASPFSGSRLVDGVTKQPVEDVFKMCERSFSLSPPSWESPSRAIMMPSFDDSDLKSFLGFDSPFKATACASPSKATASPDAGMTGARSPDHSPKFISKQIFNDLMESKSFCHKCRFEAHAMALDNANKTHSLLQKAKSQGLHVHRCPPPIAVAARRRKEAPLGPGVLRSCGKDLAAAGKQEEKSEGLKHEYPYAFSPKWGSMRVDMQDIVEDGMPPDQRACDFRHVGLALHVKTLRHLPKMDLGSSKCDPFVKISFFEQYFETTTKKQTYDATYEETFPIFVHAVNVRSASKKLTPQAAASAGLMVEFQCCDYDILANDTMGKTHILLQDLLDAKDGQIFQKNLFKDGSMVYGHDGEAALLTISCERAPLDICHPKFIPPTIESVLKASDGKSVPAAMQVAKNPFEKATDGPGEPQPNSKTFTVSNRNINSGHVRNARFGMDFASEVGAWDGKKTLDGDTYWREALEKMLETLAFNMFVMLMVFIDICNVLVTFLLTGKESVEQFLISAFVLSVFFIEITLRQIAQGSRFFKQWWNFFDMMVIYISVGLALASYLLANSSPGMEEASNSTPLLRLLSRIATGLRLLRIFTNVKRVNQMQGRVTKHLRAAVSQNKRRYARHGFDLDLTYITDRVIAMSAPALGGHSAYRNDIHVVSRFLSTRHYGSFFVFNLCDTFFSSDGAIVNYHSHLFFDHVQRIPFEDHGPPLMSEMIHFCQEATKWLQSDPSNIMAVHCKGGKGRTGVMIAAFLLWCGHRQCAMDAMELFTFRRTENYDPSQGVTDTGDFEEENLAKTTLNQTKKRQPNRGVDGPSQQRYVFYIEAMMYCNANPFISRPQVLHTISLPLGKPQKDGWWISYTVRCQRTLVLDSFHNQEAMFCCYGGQNQEPSAQAVPEDVMILPAGVFLNGDTRIEFFRHTHKKDARRKLVWFIVFHPSFYLQRQEIVFVKKKIDMLHKDKDCKLAEENFKVTLHLENLSEDSLHNGNFYSPFDRSLIHVRCEFALASS